MDRHRHWRDWGCQGSGNKGVVIGALIVLVGVLLLLQNMNIPGIHDIWRFWPAALIVLGLARLTEPWRPTALLWAAILIVVGTGLLVDNLDIVHIEIGVFIWPLLLIVFGISLLVRNMESRAARASGNPAIPTSKGGDLSHFAVFGGGKRRVDSADFKGGDLFAFFGGVDLDLSRGCTIPPAGEAVIEANAIFGGVDLRVPESWRVDIRGVGIFGGFEDKTLPPRDPLPGNAPRLVINGYAIFGGVSVKN